MDNQKCPKHYFNLHGSIFVMFLGYSEKNQLEKFFFTSIWNLETVCWHIDTRWPVFYLSKGECLKEPIQNEIISKLKNTF